MNKKGFVVIAVVVLILLIVGSVSGYIIYRFQTTTEQLEETLKDFSLDTVTDEEVVEKTIASLDRSRRRHSGENSGAHRLGYEDSDHDRCQYTVEKIKGFYVVSASKVVDAKIAINISSEIYAGEGKIAIIQDDKVVEYVEFGTSVAREYEVTGESLFFVKIICDDAKIELTVERQITK